MQTEITVTKYNVTAALGWLGLIIGLVSGVIQYFSPSSPAIWFLSAGLIGGGIAITFSGPLKTRTKRTVTLNPVDQERSK